MKRAGRGSDDEVTGKGTLSPWEALVVDAVGHAIDFWKFKRNQGRVWAILYLRDCSMTAQDLQDTLGLSKGAVSMLVRELEGWGVLRRSRVEGDDSWHYRAETNLMQMIGRVLSEREIALVESVREDLEQALQDAKRDGADDATLDRIRRMRSLASIMERALRAFLSTARFDVGSAVAILTDDEATRGGSEPADR